MNTARRYTMTTRAKSVEATRQRILDATVALGSTAPIASISLESVAERAQTSVQTVLRHFGSRADLLEVATEYAAAQVLARRATTPGDIDTAMSQLIREYDAGEGATALLLLAQEETDPDSVRQILARSKGAHRQWVTEVFAPKLAGDDELLDLLVVATDVYTWKLLRRDRGLSRQATEQRMLRLIDSILLAAKEPP
jgi:AcrR family transcriptional regulator